MPQSLSPAELTQVFEANQHVVAEWTHSIRQIVSHPSSSCGHAKKLLDILESDEYAYDVWQFACHFNLALVVCAFEVNVDETESKQVLIRLTGTHPPLAWLIQQEIESIDLLHFNPCLKNHQNASNRLKKWLLGQLL